MLAALDKRKGSPGLPSSSFFQGQDREDWDPFQAGHEGAIPDVCLLGRRMAVWRGNGILMEPGQGRSGTRGQNACGTAKNYAIRIGKRGGGNKLRTSGPGVGGQESRPDADLGRPGSGNGPSEEEGQSMKRAERAQGTTGVRAFGRGGSRHAAGPWAQKKPLQFPARAKYGGPSGTRTPNQLIKSQLLYQLS